MTVASFEDHGEGKKNIVVGLSDVGVHDRTRQDRDIIQVADHGSLWYRLSQNGNSTYLVVQSIFQNYRVWPCLTFLLVAPGLPGSMYGCSRQETIDVIVHGPFRPLQVKHKP